MILKKDDIIEVIKCYDNIIEMRYNDDYINWWAKTMYISIIGFIK